jgi:hypothetical protein
MDNNTRQSLVTMLTYLREVLNWINDDEERHWAEESLPESGHIYRDIHRVEQWLNLVRAKSTAMQHIKNLSQLRDAVLQGKSEFRVLLRGGVYSRKTIALLSDGRFKIVNHSDKTVQKLTPKGLRTTSILGKAMDEGALLAELNRRNVVASSWLVLPPAKLAR